MVHGSYQIMIMIIYIYRLISLGPRDTTRLVQFSKGIVYFVDQTLSLSLSLKKSKTSRAFSYTNYMGWQLYTSKNRISCLHMMTLSGLHWSVFQLPNSLSEMVGAYKGRTHPLSGGNWY